MGICKKLENLISEVLKQIAQKEEREEKEIVRIN